MEWKRDKKLFDQLSSKCGSSFAAIQQLAKSSRQKMIQSNNVISESEALTWALTSVQPEDLKKRMKIKETLQNVYQPVRFYQEQYMEDLLASVDDIDIRHSVRESFVKSKEAGHLIYMYINELSDGNKARVRILTNLVWYYDTSDKYN